MALIRILLWLMVLPVHLMWALLILAWGLILSGSILGILWLILTV